MYKMKHYNAFCVKCTADISIGHGGKNNIEQN